MHSLGPTLQKKRLEYTRRAVVVLCTLLCIVSAAIVIYGIYIFFVPAQDFTAQPLSNGNYFVQVGSNSFAINAPIDGRYFPGTQGIASAKTASQLNLLVGCITIGGTLTLFVSLHAMLSDIQKGQPPFTQKSCHCLRYIALIVLFSALLPFLTPTLMYLFCDGVWIVDALSLMPALLGGALLYCLASIFDYGHLLQEEYDATV